MKFQIAQNPDEIIAEYNLENKVHSNGFVYIEIQKGMYGLPQAGMLANKLLKHRLAQHRYYEVCHTPGYWQHTWQPIDFTLVVDDFGIGYEENEHAPPPTNIAQVLRSSLCQLEGHVILQHNLKMGLSTKDMRTIHAWICPTGCRQISTQDQKSNKTVDAPHPYKATINQRLPMTQPIDGATKLAPQAIKHLQQIVGISLFSRAVNPTMLTALRLITTEQTQGTQTTKEKAEHFLNYVAMHPNTSFKFYKSDMILKIHSNTSYLSEQQGRSRTGRHIYLGNRDDTTNPPNGPILNTMGILANVMSAASESEVAPLITNMKEGVIQRIALEEMQWPQPPTPITVDNSTVAGLARDTIKANKSRAMDMCLHWIQDRAQQHQFLVIWAPGKLYKADYFTKLHAPIHHWHMQFVYLHPPSPPTNPAHLSLANLSCGGALNPGFHPRVDNPDVTGIPQINYSTSK